MPHLALRDDDNNTRKKRQAQLGRGPGTFVYDGTLDDVSHIPTPMLSGSQDVLLDSEGFPVTDGAGRAVYKPAGRPVIDIHGKVVMGGVPKVVRKQRDVVTLRGVTFKKGEPVYISSASLALKLRGMPAFDEIPSDEDASEGKALSRPATERAAELANKPSPGRKHKKKNREEPAEETDTAEE